MIWICMDIFMIWIVTCCPVSDTEHICWEQRQRISSSFLFADDPCLLTSSNVTSSLRWGDLEQPSVKHMERELAPLSLSLILHWKGLDCPLLPGVSLVYKWEVSGAGHWQMYLHSFCSGVDAVSVCCGNERKLWNTNSHVPALVYGHKLCVPKE